MNNYSKKRVGILGFRGYSGEELVRLLARHPGIDLALLEHRSDEKPAALPLGAIPYNYIPATAEAAAAEKLDLVFLATQPDISAPFARDLLRHTIRVVDLSGAFRLGDAETYSRWYGERHPAPDLIKEAVYGLTEWNRDRIASAGLVANPGCYPTAANLALKPLIAAEVIDRSRGVICDAKSGVTGAGRKPSAKTMFGEVGENFSAYGFFEHRHIPEVLQNSGLGEREFTFTAQLLPIRRGILETIYFRIQTIAEPVELLSILEAEYASEPFVRLYAPGRLPDLHSVQYTNFCDLGFVFDPSGKRVTLVAAIDNLGKGAAGQAIQNMNLMLGMPETECLL